MDGLVRYVKIYFSHKGSIKQERPPAWTQEAYRPLCSKYSLCCPNWVPPRGGTGPPQGTPQGGTRPPWVPPGGWYQDPPGYPRGYRDPPVPPRGYQNPPPGGTGTPPGGYWTPPPVDRQTPVKTVPSRRTTYAGGNDRVRASYVTYFHLKRKSHLGCAGL